jgi:chromosome partitioning protein
VKSQLSAWGRIFPAIPRATAFVDATEERAPLAVFDPKHSVVNILEEIANSLEAL